MKRVISTLVAAAGVCGVANAATTVEILLSTNGVDFSSTINPPGGGSGLQTIQVLVSVSTTNPNAIGLGSMIFQPTVSNWTSTDALVPFTAAFGSNTSTPSGAVADASGQYGRITPWAAVSNSSAQRLFGHVHQNGSGGAPPGGFLRIAQAQVTSWIGGTANTSGGSGVNIKQLSNIGRTASDPAFNGNVTSVHVFRYAVQLDTSAIRGGSGLLGVRFDAPASGFGNLNTTTGQREVYWYANLNEASGSIREVPTVIPGIIAPSPGAIAVIGLGMMGVARRRRR
jgi:hypothetical protein